MYSANDPQERLQIDTTNIREGTTPFCWNGYMVCYEYDAFGRQKRVIDDDGNVVSTNSYNYRHP